MDKDRVKGAVDQAAGRVQKAAGDLSGDKKLKAEGTLKETKGKVRTAVGEVKDAARKTIK